MILVGCVKSKIETVAAVRAKDLYDSPLWRCRREYAERFAPSWYILSAKHHLLHPEKKIETYDSTMTGKKLSERSDWSDEVWEGLSGKFPDLRGKVVEIHAGKSYAESGLEKKLREAGAIVHRPLKRVRGIGLQCAWYRGCLAASRSGAREDIERTSYAARLAAALAGDFYDKGKWTTMLDVAYAGLLCCRGATEREARLFLTFISAMDRFRSSEDLWEKGFGLFVSHPELFDPARIPRVRSLETLLRESGVSKLHEQDVPAWRRIAESLRSRPLSPVRRVIDGGVGDAVELLEDLCGWDRAGRPLFPLLRGPKIGAMWVRMMAEPGGARIGSMDVVPVAVDTHVRRITECLRVTDTRRLSMEKARPTIQRFWKKAVGAVDIGGPAGIAGTCAALDPALWYFGKNCLADAPRTRRVLGVGEDWSACRSKKHQKPRGRDRKFPNEPLP